MTPVDTFESFLKKAAIAGVLVIAALLAMSAAYIQLGSPLSKTSVDFWFEAGLLMMIPLLVHKAVEMTMPFVIGLMVVLSGKRWK